MSASGLEPSRSNSQSSGTAVGDESNSPNHPSHPEEAQKLTAQKRHIQLQPDATGTHTHKLEKQATRDLNRVESANFHPIRRRTTSRFSYRSADGGGANTNAYNPSGKRELTEDDPGVEDVLATSFPELKKWWIITVIFIVQCSMNFNAAIYANGVEGISEHFEISEQAARVGSAVFLVMYAIGSQLWAPWSEELGRKVVLQVSLFLVNVFSLPCALAPNYGSLVVGRFFGGLFSAGGSVTLGMVADMWSVEDQQYPVAYVVFSSVGGSAIGPIVGPFVQAYLSWRWIFWLQLIFGGATQILHFFTVPETRSSVLIDREAKRRREQEGEDVWGPNELVEHRFTTEMIFTTWFRPFEMFVREPIVLCCSLLSGFSDALIFTFMESFTLVYQQYNFQAPITATTFIPIWIGYFIAWASYIIPIQKYRKLSKTHPERVTPESKLWWLLFLAPLETIGLFGFAWTSLGPPKVPWIAPMIFSTLVAIANYGIYMSTIDYMVAAYGPYSSSATGGNAFARDGLAGIATMYSTPMYNTMGLEWASTVLAFLALLVTVPIFVFYWKGAYLRERSKFAIALAEDRTENKGRQVIVDEKEHGNVNAAESDPTL